MKLTRTAAFLTGLAVLGAVSDNVACAASSHVPEYDCADGPTQVRAFIYADHTVIQLDSYGAALGVRDDSGGTIGFTREGRFARLDGKLNHFTALVNGEPVECTRHGWTSPHAIRVSVPVAAPPAVPGAPASTVPQAAAAAGGTARAPVAASAALGLDANEKVVVVPEPAHGTLAPKAASVAAVPPIIGAKATAPVHASAAVSASAPAVTSASTTSQPSLDVATLTRAASGAVVSAPVAAVPAWTLRRGRLVSRELQEIGDHFGWHVDWLYPREIVVPADTTYPGDFTQVATAAVNTLKSNGLLINARFYNGNKYLVVRGAGTTPQ